MTTTNLAPLCLVLSLISLSCDDGDNGSTPAGDVGETAVNTERSDCEALYWYDLPDHPVNAPGCNLSGHRLRGVDLSNANFEGADLSSVDLRDAKLIGADLSYTELWSSWLMGADLTNANLRGSRMNIADLSGANLTGVDFNDTILFNVRWGGATCPDGTKLPEDDPTDLVVVNCDNHLNGAIPSDRTERAPDVVIAAHLRLRSTLCDLADIGRCSTHEGRRSFHCGQRLRGVERAF